MNSFLKWIWLAEKCGAGSSDVLKLVEKIGSIEDKNALIKALARRALVRSGMFKSTAARRI